MTTRPALRAAQRKRRRNLSPHVRDEASQRMCRRLVGSHFFHAARRIAAYLPNDGEIDPGPAIAQAWEAGREVYLPVLRPGRRLGFAAFTPRSELAPNRFGIPEPVVDRRHLIDGRGLDLVLMPVVAFDERCNRIGMGGGYYDRTFAFLRRRRQWFRPRLVGVAYGFQCVAEVQPENWDVPLWRVVTDTAIFPIRE